MKRLFLITDFLGAGKTTFVNRYFQMFPSDKTMVIVNEYGKVGIDGAVLSKTGHPVEEITDGSIFCACRSDQLMDALERAAATDAETVLIEASGLSDPTHMDDILEQIQRLSGTVFDYRGCIALVDARNFEKVLATAVVTPSQVKQASLIVINKTDLVPSREIEALKMILAQFNPQARMVCAVQARIDPALLGGLRPLHGAAQGQKVDISTSTLTLAGDRFQSLKELTELMEEFKGHLYRCKGYAVIQGQCYHVDGTMAQIDILEVPQALSDRIVLLYRASSAVRHRCQAYLDRSGK